MATGRTTSKWTSCYIDNWNLAHNAIISAGPLAINANMAEFSTYGDAIRGNLPSSIDITPTTMNWVLDKGQNAYMSPDVAYVAPGAHLLTYAIGIRAAAAQGDPTFTCYAEQLALTTNLTDGAVTFNSEYGSVNATKVNAYNKAWGVLLHAFSNVTAVNSATGVDDTPGGAATTAGGFMVYHVYGGTGTVTLKVQHASTNSDGSFADLGGCTTGVVTQTGIYGIVPTTATTTTVNRYLRWQIVLGTASACNFAMAFVRG